MRLAWKKYYWRVLGIGLMGFGLFLIGEEFVSTGQLQLGVIEHEFYGLILFIIGFFVTTFGGKGKK